MKDSTRQTYEERVLRVLRYIQEHLDDAIDLEELANVACFSPFHFHRIFKGMVGESVMEYVRRLRLERAAGRLMMSDQAVTRIAFEAGYDAHESFIRAFRIMFGQTPSEYRKLHTSIFADAPTGVSFGLEVEPDDFMPIESGGAVMEVRVEKIEPMQVACVRHVGPYAEMGEAFGKLMSWAGRNGVLGPECKILTIYYDDPEVTPTDKLRCDACVSIGEGVSGDGEVSIQEIAGGEYAVATHRGSFDTMAETYAMLYGQWPREASRELKAAPGFEVYLTDPGSTAPEDLLTDVYVPLESA